MTHFDRLGLPPSFAIDPAELERRYLARSRELHPDYHTDAASAEQRASMELTAALNEAYVTLKQPFRRAEYLLGLLGGPSAAEHKQMDPAFLEEMLDLRMEIEQLRAGGDPDSPARQAMAAQLTKRLDQLSDAIAPRFAKALETSDGANRQKVLVELRQALNSAKYIQGLLRDLRAD